MRWVGSTFGAVHRWIDQYSLSYGAGHRKFLHHVEGIDEARRVFGDQGAAAATVHILRDCRNIPAQEDYETGKVDALGLRKEWPVAAYAKFTEEAFAALVEYTLHGPIGIIVWAFFRNATDLDNLLQAVSRLTDEKRAECVRRFPEVLQRVAELPPTSLSEPRTRTATNKVLEHFNAFAGSPFYQELLKQFSEISLTYVPVGQLINPLVLIDYENVERLRATLEGEDEASVARFALPTQVTAPVKILADPSHRSAIFVSPHKNLTIMGLTFGEVPGSGVEVRFFVSGAPDTIMVSHASGRFYLRNGIHRAYLLASIGMQELPCILVQETQFPAIVGPYPAFAPSILALPRPPLLIDAFKDELSLKVPLQRTQKIIRIAAEELILPSD